MMERKGRQSVDATTSSEMTASGQGALWKYGGISLELTAHLIQEQARYLVPTYASEGWGHAYLKIVIAAHLLDWGYRWGDILWEYAPPDITGRKRADIFARGHNRLPSFWFECRTVGGGKFRELCTALLPDIRLVNVMPLEWFLRWWNGEHLRLEPSLSMKEKRAAIRKHRAETSVAGVEYWAIYDTPVSARILFAVRADGNDHYTYFDTGEGWSINHIMMLSRRTDCWAPLIPGRVGDNQESRHDTYLPRSKRIDGDTQGG